MKSLSRNTRSDRKVQVQLEFLWVAEAPWDSDLTLGPIREREKSASQEAVDAEITSTQNLFGRDYLLQKGFYSEQR